MGRASEFLELYKEVEEALQIRYMRHPNERISNAIVRFMNSPEGKRFKEELNLCREVRNLLSHHARFEGEDVVAPSEKLLAFLKKLLHYLENPPEARGICTKTEFLLRASRETQLLDVFARMEKKGFSHVPIMEGDRLYGVLSISTVFTYYKNNPDERLGRDARVERLWDILPPEEHTNERFAFVAPNCPYERLRVLFAEGGPKTKRLAAAFVTANGTKEARLLGMITPWDMLRVDDLG